MLRFYMAAAMTLACAIPAFAHFVFIVPPQTGTTLSVVMSETLEPDEAVKLGPVAELKLFSRAIDGENAAIKLTPHDHHLTAQLPVRHVVFGSMDYGVSNRGGQPVLLKYHPKAIVGTVPMLRQRLGKVPAEIVSHRASDGIQFAVLLADAPAAKVDVTVLLPDGETKKVTTDAAGKSPSFAATGRYGVWARVVENVAGEHNGQKYSQIRHYPTLVIDHSKYPPLPEAVSSFGAAVADGWAYVYGGHRSKVHSYDTTAVTGGWRRLNLVQPGAWEELPGGMPLQGMALVAYQGKLIRIGGMAPRNSPGTSADNYSTDSCAIYDPAAKSWSALPNLPQARSSHDAVVVGGSLIVIGGWNMRGSEGKDWLDDALVLDMENRAAGWKSLPQPFHRRALQTGVLGTKVYVVGGLTEEDTISAAVSVYDPIMKTWSEGPELPGGRKAGFNPGICTSNNRLFVCVGDGTVARLSTDGSKWETIAKVSPRVVHRLVAASDNTLLVIGGAAAGENLDAVEAVKVVQ